MVKPGQAAKPSIAEDFSKAFSEVQEICSKRGLLGWMWPLAEIFGDKSKPSMKIVDAYLGPILEEALKKHRDAPASEKGKDDVEDDDTLLDHLIRRTSGRSGHLVFKAASDGLSKTQWYFTTSCSIFS